MKTSRIEKLESLALVILDEVRKLKEESNKPTRQLKINTAAALNKRMQLIHKKK